MEDNEYIPTGMNLRDLPGRQRTRFAHPPDDDLIGNLADDNDHQDDHNSDHDNDDQEHHDDDLQPGNQEQHDQSPHRNVHFSDPLDDDDESHDPDVELNRGARERMEYIRLASRTRSYSRDDITSDEALADRARRQIEQDEIEAANLKVRLDQIEQNRKVHIEQYNHFNRSQTHERQQPPNINLDNETLAERARKQREYIAQQTDQLRQQLADAEKRAKELRETEARHRRASAYEQGSFTSSRSTATSSSRVPTSAPVPDASHFAAFTQFMNMMMGQMPKPPPEPPLPPRTSPGSRNVVPDLQTDLDYLDRVNNMFNDIDMRAPTVRPIIPPRALAGQNVPVAGADTTRSLQRRHIEAVDLMAQQAQLMNNLIYRLGHDDIPPDTIADLRAATVNTTKQALKLKHEARELSHQLQDATRISDRYQLIATMPDWNNVYLSLIHI